MLRVIVAICGFAALLCVFTAQEGSFFAPAPSVVLPVQAAGQAMPAGAQMLRGSVFLPPSPSTGGFSREVLGFGAVAMLAVSGAALMRRSPQTPERSSLAPAFRASVPVMQSVEVRKAIPFLKKPPALDGTLPGDVFFDPLGFTSTITELGGDLNYVREAELMHGRVSMLASVGFIFPAMFGKLNAPWTAGVSVNPIEAQYQLPGEVYSQLFVSMAIAEGLRSRIIFKEDSVPGEHGFDPLNYIKTFGLDDPEKMKVMKTKEILNGRLAMLAVTGFWFQLMITGEIVGIPGLSK